LVQKDKDSEEIISRMEKRAKDQLMSFGQEIEKRMEEKDSEIELKEKQIEMLKNKIDKLVV
jgi:hypothetical protein